MDSKVADLLIEKKDAVFSLLDRESVDVYLWLCQAYPSKVDDRVFRFVYRSFYRLDNAGLSETCKSEYFDLLNSRETDLRRILDRLHKHPTLKGLNSYQLSFATKLIHTIDNSRPIYDSLVAKVFNFPTKKTAETQLDWCLKTYALLIQEYAELLGDKRLKPLIAEFKRTYCAESISDAKALDFLLWGLGRVLLGRSTAENGSI